MNQGIVDRLKLELNEIREAGLYKTERIIESAQGAEIVVGGKTVLNFCANNYLGLSSHPRVIEAAHQAIEQRGFGMSSVRFICGTQDIHKELERQLKEKKSTWSPEKAIEIAKTIFSVQVTLNESDETVSKTMSKTGKSRR